MAKVHGEITDELRAFIARQHVFFVASAPRRDDGHINLSPKGVDSFRVLSPTRVAYVDLTGSGNETAAHVLENGRITFMFCAFDGPPNILRLYGKGHAVLPDQPEWAALVESFVRYPGTRQIIVADIERVQTSCGFGVPRYEYVGERDHLFQWAEKKGDAGLQEYQRAHSRYSIDGLPTPLGKAR